MLESICQFAISAYLYWMRPAEEFNEDQITAIGQKFSAYFCLICLVVVTGMSIGMIFIHEDILMSKPVKRRIFMLYEF